MCERNTTLGKIAGIEKDGIMNWFGIPSAKPPIGKLRFKRVVPHEPREGVLDCKMMGPKPWQKGCLIFRHPFKIYTPDIGQRIMIRPYL